MITAADIAGINRFGVIPPFADQPALAEGTARFRGEAVQSLSATPNGCQVPICPIFRSNGRRVKRLSR